MTLSYSQFSLASNKICISLKAYLPSNEIVYYCLLQKNFSAVCQTILSLWSSETLFIQKFSANVVLMALQMNMKLIFIYSPFIHSRKLMKSFRKCLLKTNFRILSVEYWLLIFVIMGVFRKCQTRGTKYSYSIIVLMQPITNCKETYVKSLII